MRGGGDDAKSVKTRWTDDLRPGTVWTGSTDSENATLQQRPISVLTSSCASMRRVTGKSDASCLWSLGVQPDAQSEPASPCAADALELAADDQNAHEQKPDRGKVWPTLRS